ncbi:MAG: hypothetical protein ACTJHT_15645 [Sphingobacterium sp.]|uniref:hypothetical protein n=1 Tax=Sphingobacterium sp. JB170 TaxID=1434842 RepID=UPI00097F3060|nr:hypothetical protein [Sphingobacterium sp. JB170]SJN27502.1 hypothetical protein FM107_05355 [Sphingobacterium sp. JB170]
MKTTIKMLSFLCIALFTFASCSKDDDPADNILFADKYRGNISFTTTSEQENVPISEGTVTVTKVGDTYNFAFSNGIPNINGIEFEQRGDNTYWNIGGSTASYIQIDADNLTIAYVQDGDAWTANCSRD